MSKFNAVQAAVIDQDNRNMARAGSGVDAMSVVLNDLQDQIDSGSIGITANAGDVDSLALNGGAFGYDASLANNLNFGYRSGRALVGQTYLAVASGSILLAASSTNYVELDPSGVGAVVSNTSGFTAGRLPLYVVVTGVSTVSTVTNVKTLLVVHGTSSVTGLLLSTAAKTKTIELSLGDLAATADGPIIICPNNTGTLTRATFVTKTAVTADDTNYWTFSLMNKGAANAGTTAMLAATNANTTKATGGAAMAAYVTRALTLNGTPANLNHAAEDVLVFTVTKTATATTMQACTLKLDFSNVN